MAMRMNQLQLYATCEGSHKWCRVKETGHMVLFHFHKVQKLFYNVEGQKRGVVSDWEEQVGTWGVDHISLYLNADFTDKVTFL